MMLSLYQTPPDFNGPKWDLLTAINKVTIITLMSSKDRMAIRMLCHTGTFANG